ncbi:hypothetical protein EOL70_10130 [Leucothrix sargassi]|nr:hypothetical protein EOL70_10130 [Leucothrix sargassi]
MSHRKSLDEKIIAVNNIIDWQLLERQLGHHFDHQNVFSCRLIIGLLYLKAMSDSSYEETIERWKTTKLWHSFCDAKPSDLQQALRASTISIYEREIGDTGEYWMHAALKSAILKKYYAKGPRGVSNDLTYQPELEHHASTQ